MKEPARLERNKLRLSECFPPFAERLRKVLDAMEAQGFRPRIQDGFRTEAAQLEAFINGNSDVTFGFHNCTDADGKPDSLACDVLDDDNPNSPPTRYLLALTLAARKHGLDTLIKMHLDSSEKAALEKVLATGDIEQPARVGDDPTHVEVIGVTINQAKNGKRPKLGLGLQTTEEEADDMPLNKDDLKAIDELVRKILEEGTGQGQDTWAKTNKVLLATVQRLVNDLGKLQKEVTDLKKKVG